MGDMTAKCKHDRLSAYCDLCLAEMIEDMDSVGLNSDEIALVVAALRRTRPEARRTVDESILYEAAWELRKVILAYESWVANPYSGARAQEMSIHLCSARDWLEKRDLKHLGVGNLEELSKALKSRLDAERGPQGESK